MNIPTLKEKFLGCVDKWLAGRINDMLQDHSMMAVPAVYLKRGCHNIITKNKGIISDGIDKATLFLADENGNIDANIIFTDVMEILKSMEETTFDMGIVKGVAGKGKVSLTLPDNIFINILFGNKKTISFGESDFLELKTLLATN